MGFSIWHLLIVLVVIFLFFGVGRIQETMGELGKGVKAFKEGMGEEPEPQNKPKPARKPKAKPKAKVVAKAKKKS